MTFRADCIRLLAAIGMNICLEVWRLSTVMQPHIVYNKHKELLQSCYWKQRKFNIWRWPCPLDFYFSASDTALTRSSVLWQEELRSLISVMPIVKTLPRWDKCIRVLWDYVKKYWHLSEIIVLHFMLLWQSFSLWHREHHFLNSLPYLFTVMYAALCHDQKLRFLVV